MKIALDYDKTYSLEPAFWDGFILACNDQGHEVRIVTARDERYDRTEAIAVLERSGIVPIIWTRGVAKKWFLSHFGEGFLPDIWIDDKPESILENSEYTPDKLTEWRASREDGAHVSAADDHREHGRDGSERYLDWNDDPAANAAAHARDADEGSGP